MAEPINTTSDSGSTATSAPQSSGGTATSAPQSSGSSAAPKRTGTTRRRTTTRGTTPARKATTARRARTGAQHETAEAAKATARQGQATAERFTLIGVGATLEARDRVIEFVTDWYETFAAPLTSREAAEKQLRKFERRGTTERNRLERQAKNARTRVERELRTRRREAVAAGERVADRVAVRL